MSHEEEKSAPGTFEAPELPPPAERSLELPAVIIGDRGNRNAAPVERLLPGRVPESLVLYPAYTLTLMAGILGAQWALRTEELNPLMLLLAWCLLFCWYWVYGVAYRYRRWLMKSFALFISSLTALALTFFSALRSTSLYLPAEAGLALRPPQPILLVVAALTLISLAAIISHVLYLGRGYRKKSTSVVNLRASE